MKISELRNQQIQARRVPDAESGEVEQYELAFIDKDTAEVIHVRFSREVRDALVGQLHGSGLVVAGTMPSH